jgi:hypothetical protein
MKSVLFASAALAMGLMVAACAPKAEAPAEPAAPPVTETSCPDDGPRLAATGLCQGRAINYFDPTLVSAPGDLPEGCQWVVNDVALPGDEAMLYLAAQCGARTTQLEFSAGAESAALYQTASGLFDPVPTYEGGQEPVRLWLAETQDAGRARILEIVRGTVTDAEGPLCELRAAGEFYPADALIADISAANREGMGFAAPDSDMVESACGPFGFAPDAVQYWRVRQGFAWWFNLGQDLPDFVPATLTLMRKDEAGNWAVVAD